MRNISLEKLKNKLIASISENTIAYLGEAGKFNNEKNIVLQ